MERKNKLSKNGFAITGILYSIFLLVIVFLVLLLTMLANNYLSFSQMQKEVKNKLDEVSYAKDNNKVLASVVKNGLIVYYDKNQKGSNNNIWQDLSGNNNHGTIHNATWTADGLLFDGNDDWVEIKKIDLTTVTLEVMVKINLISSNTQSIIANVQVGGHELYFSDKIQAHTFLNTNYSEIVGDSLMSNRFYHLVYTYDGLSQKIYIDGNLIQEQPASGTVKQPANDTIWALGTDPNGLVSEIEFLNGTISLARIYDRALTFNEVMQNYLSTR